MALADVGAGDMHLGAHGLQVQDFFGGHLVGHHQHHAVALGPADQRKPQAGVAGGGFDDGAAGAQAAVAFGGVNHGQADAVFDGTTGVLAFKFEEQRAQAGIKSADLDQRRVADQFEYGGAGKRGHVVTWYGRGVGGGTAKMQSMAWNIGRDRAGRNRAVRWMSFFGA